MVRRSRHISENSSKIATEGEILEGYLRVACAEGVENITLKKVAAEAGVAYSTVHYYFGKTSSCLIESALNHVAKSSEKFLLQKLDAVATSTEFSSVFAYVDAKFEWNKKFPTYASMLCYFIYQTTRDKGLRKYSTELYFSNLKRLQALLLLDIGKGIFANIMDKESLTEKIQTILSGALLSDASTDANKDNGIKNMTVQLIKEQILNHSTKQIISSK